jgi:catechol 2,3-dioxygenase-like lactoylglutathione lyase family enzyme
MELDFSQVSDVTIFVDDIQESLKLYHGLLGLRVGFQSDGFVVLDTRPITINLHSTERPLTPDVSLRHNAPQVTLFVDDLDAANNYLRSVGVRITREPMMYPSGEKMMGFMDSDGNQIALLEKS